VSRVLSRRALGALLVSGVGCGLGAPLTVYVVRHAEKDPEGDKKDPPLSAVGKRRAETLARLLDGVDLRGVYATTYRRTKETVAPAAAAHRLGVQALAPGDLRGLVARVRAHAGGAALVAGHSNTVPEIAAALGVRETIVIDEASYGELFVVRAATFGATLDRGRFDPP
jgi:phosphohistidine phosphatase SixA